MDEDEFYRRAAIAIMAALCEGAHVPDTSAGARELADEGMERRADLAVRAAYRLTTRLFHPGEA